MPEGGGGGSILYSKHNGKCAHGEGLGLSSRPYSFIRLGCGENNFWIKAQIGKGLEINALKCSATVGLLGYRRSLSPTT